MLRLKILFVSNLIESIKSMQGDSRGYAAPSGAYSGCKNNEFSLNKHVSGNVLRVRYRITNNQTFCLL